MAAVSMFLFDRFMYVFKMYSQCKPTQALIYVELFNCICNSFAVFSVKSFKNTFFAQNVLDYR